MAELRHEYLRAQVSAVQARIRMLSGTKLPFDQESKALYDAVAPTYPAAHFDAVLKELDALVPGPGALADRVEAFRQQFVIPPAKLERVFRRAIAECRARTTAAHGAAARARSFTVEYVTNKPWSGYNWYQGNYHSLIQVNTELPIYHRSRDRSRVPRGLSRAITSTTLLLEQHLVRGPRLAWSSPSIRSSRRSRSSRKARANFGIEVAFPGDERVAFERDVLFPLAGLDPSTGGALLPGARAGSTA